MPVGFIVDAATGTITKYTRSAYNVDMSRGSVAVDARSLDRTGDGALVVPSTPGDLVVSDAETGLSFVFQK